MTEQMTPTQDMGLTILKMVRSKLTVDALGRALERADERYTEAVVSSANWAGRNPLDALLVVSVLLGGIQTELRVNGDSADTVVVERREAVENALAALEDLVAAFNDVHDTEGEPVAAG
jgi:hypothetical protein